jgi:hypothetical protein
MIPSFALFCFNIHQIVKIRSLNPMFISKHQCHHSKKYQENRLESPELMFTTELKVHGSFCIEHYRKSENLQFPCHRFKENEKPSTFDIDEVERLGARDQTRS